MASLVERTLANAIATADGQSITAERASKWGERIVELRSVKMHGLADEGAYFTAVDPLSANDVNPISINANATTQDDTKPALIVVNNYASNGLVSNKRIFLDYLRLYCATASANGTAIRWAIKIDSASRVGTPGGTTITAQNVNFDDSTVSKSLIYFGALTASAATASVRLVAMGRLREANMVVGDTYEWSFGAVDHSMNSLIPSGTAIANVQTNTAPVVLGSQHAMYFHLWMPAATTAPKFDLELGYYER